MKKREISRTGAVGAAIAFIIWLIINLRVEAGVGTTFERALDGLVAGAVLLVAIFLAWQFFQCDGNGENCGIGGFCLRKGSRG